MLLVAGAVFSCSAVSMSSLISEPHTMAAVADGRAPPVVPAPVAPAVEVAVVLVGAAVADEVAEDVAATGLRTALVAADVPAVEDALPQAATTATPPTARRAAGIDLQRRESG